MPGPTSAHTERISEWEPDPLPWSALRRRLRKADLLDETIAGAEAPDPDTLVLDGLTDDSRAVTPGGGFVAIRGVDADGHSFIDMAVDNGARLVVCEALPTRARERFPGVVFARVTDTRTALAEGAAALHGDPADELRLVGVTGTNGKTTVAYLVHHLLEALGETAGLLSTIKVQVGGETTAPALTTPGPLVLHRTLRRMVDRGCTACAMEVSSHALDQDRVYGLDYEVAIFTTLSVDHLDYHDTLDDYRAAKKTLFDALGPDATALYNADDEAGPTMVADTEARVVSFGLDRDADIEATVLEARLDGQRVRLDGHERDTQLAGRFNASNMAAAYGTGTALGHAPEAVADALADAPPVPGRVEPLRFGDGTTVIVDYAHTPDALENVLRTVRDTTPAKAALWCVFGCGGDRDAGKRPTMGRIAERLADRVIVTSDNPRTEAPVAILRDIRDGVERPESMRWIVDREEAIQAAADETMPGDVVVIAGKGHETTQTIGTDTLPFDDREVARRYFG
ncbi:UDP-N-acetylmuramoyl-L-alanyl-D-glutamate--2,6-diaminopimelate ligase [Salinibacter ruber]|uniref:UDP-N-acetylmuramoyl-L-alanyl-D-glutamate--2, 6-diaminopimelate ligase n=1 Tax=Salinibacter ruber TaxID=146919 RepID=UPI002168F8C3|nr:UDP-N-acetylmuramoyl-L-alanyl-D-glutamate--2,6-diaminopimelate ligase [Salinibacter ruber]MCS3861711.1 UDP-N-acetylmuramoyl-L-alanyl-D-glutamate--2,6-diaminopimelate ligase [Salinibacter ruber]